MTHLTTLSANKRSASPWQKSRVAPRTTRRPAGKARGARISGIFERRATPSAGMHRRSNAAGLLPRAASACAWLLVLGLAQPALGGEPAPGGEPASGAEPAPGSEPVNAQRARVDYMLNCQGCHLPDGDSAGDVPRMKDFVGNFLKVPGGREFLVQVPGSANAALDDARLADCSTGCWPRSAPNNCLRISSPTRRRT